MKDNDIIKSLKKKINQSINIFLYWILDEHNGDCICRYCGTVLGPVLDESPIKRIFEDDNEEEKAAKIQHTTYDPLLQDSIRSTSHRLDGDEDFIQDGYQSIDDAFNRLFPDIGHDSAMRLAKYYFKMAFQSQLEQKRGTKAMKRKAKGDLSQRKKFARRKAFVVAAILAALRKECIRRPDTKAGDPNEWFDVFDINRYVEGKDVTQKSKQKCWKELGISFDDPKQKKDPTVIKSEESGSISEVAPDQETNEANHYSPNDNYISLFDPNSSLKKKRGRPPKPYSSSGVEIKKQREF